MKVSEPRQLTSDGKHHFFGYYSYPPWSEDGRYFLYLETTFHNRMPTKGEKANIILLDLKQGTHKLIAETKAWNFQQGCWLSWLPSAPNQKLLFNDCRENHPICRIMDIKSGEIRNLPRSVMAVGMKSDFALCTNMNRHRRNRKVTSYPCTDESLSIESHPKDDGIFLLDLNTGKSKLIISLDEIWNANSITKDLEGAILDELKVDPKNLELKIPELWFDHVGFNPDENRIFLLARYNSFGQIRNTSMWTVNVDGSEPYLLVDYFLNLSHFEWINSSELIVTKKSLKNSIMNYYQIKDKIHQETILFPELLKTDGHPTLHPTGRYLATDTYIINGKRHVYIIDLKTGELHTVATFDNPKEINGDIRCDPHPRWNRDGTQLCYDGLNKNGERQIFILDFLRE